MYLVSAAATLIIVGLLLKALPQQAAPDLYVPFPQLIGSIFTLFVELPVLRIRAILTPLIFAAKTMLLTPMVLLLAAPPFSWSHTEIGLFGLAGIAGAFGAARAGRLANRGLVQRTTGIALMIMLIAWCMVAFVSYSLWGLIVGMVLMDFGLISVHFSNQSLIYHVRPQAQSRLAAGYMIFYSIGCAAAAIASTLVYAAAGWSGVCLAGAVQPIMEPGQEPGSGKQRVPADSQHR